MAVELQRRIYSMVVLHDGVYTMVLYTMAIYTPIPPRAASGRNQAVRS